MKQETKTWILNRMDQLAQSLVQAKMWMLDACWSSNPRREYWRKEHTELGSLIQICKLDGVACFLHEELWKELERKL